MISASLDNFFGIDAVKEDVNATLKSLARPCTLCRLGQACPDNSGLIWKGNVAAHVAVIGDMPSDLDMQTRIAFCSSSKHSYLEEWLTTAGVPSTDVFYSYMVQCKTPSHETKEKDAEFQPIWEQRPPARDEIKRCFAPRCVRLLKALPNLEVVIPLGLATQTAFLGGNPQARTHHGFWFGSDLLPGVAFFGLPHPREFDSETGELKRGRVKQKLEYFKTEYFGRPGVGAEVIPPRKVLGILALREQERKDSRQI